jgi:hypothetical protein
VPVSTNVPEFSFVSVTEDEVVNAVICIMSTAAGVDEINLSFIKSFLPVLFGTLTKLILNLYFLQKLLPFLLFFLYKCYKFSLLQNAKFQKFIRFCFKRI